MKERIKKKLKELEESYEFWLKQYDQEMLEWQENRLHELQIKIMLLKELLDEE